MRSWFYVKNSQATVGAGLDLVNLPRYVSGPPIARHNWEYVPLDEDDEIDDYYEYILELKKEGLLKPEVLMATFISRRISPLQQRSHKISQMSGNRDPNRISTKEFSDADIRLKIKVFSATKMPTD